MVSLSVIGLNCGIDVAHTIITSGSSSPDLHIELVSYHEHPIPSALRTRILSLCRPGAPTSLEEICDLNFELGELFADAVCCSGVDLATVDIVASHGQTLWHTPIGANTGRGFNNGERRMATMQMAESAVITHRSNIQNIGGMGNVSIIPALSSPLSPGYEAFDTGPGNVLIDAAVRILTSGVQHYDKDGIMGFNGRAEIDHSYVADFIDSIEYLSRAPPKTTGRELFSDDMARSVVMALRAKGVSDDGIIANITQITGETIARAYERFVVPTYGEIDEIFVCGGGAENPNLMKFMADRFPRASVRKLNDATAPKAKMNGHASGHKAGNIPADAKEAVMFATLGFLCVSGRSVPVSSGELCKDEAVMGKITPGRNYRDVLRKVDQDAPGAVLGRILFG
ncbi:hypothetical protein P7C73_g968, partial [Tremellales sp. Uapishka_1]